MDSVFFLYIESEFEWSEVAFLHLEGSLTLTNMFFIAINYTSYRYSLLLFTVFTYNTAVYQPSKLLLNVLSIVFFMTWNSNMTLLSVFSFDLFPWLFCSGKTFLCRKYILQIFWRLGFTEREMQKAGQRERERGTGINTSPGAWTEGWPILLLSEQHSSWCYSHIKPSRRVLSQCAFGCVCV